MLVKCDYLNTVVWEKPAAKLPSDSVAIFRIGLTDKLKYIPYLASFLQAEEMERAARYYKLADQHRFIITRAVLRILLGKYAKQSPYEIKFSTGLNKKPMSENAAGLQYNVSHSQSWALVAIAGVEVGIDVEKVDKQFAFQDILQHSFNSQEKKAIQGSKESRNLFYQSWTRKEALVKATARGIDAEFHAIPSLDGIHHVPAGPTAAEWVVSSFRLSPTYVAAVAYPLAGERPGRLNFYEFDLFAA